MVEERTAAMSSATCRQEQDGLLISDLSDFEILHRITALVSKEHSVEAEILLLEIIRRFTSSRAERPREKNGESSILGLARWGDAKRVYEIFGLKRSPLDRLHKDSADGCASYMRSKRLFDLISIEKFLRSPEGKRIARNTKLAHAADGEAGFKPRNRNKRKLTRK
jgi:hypothetical protein